MTFSSGLVSLNLELWIRNMKSISLRIATPVCLVLVAAIAQGATAWKDLFNGKDFTGWSTGTAGWKVENGVIVGGQGGGRGSLVSTDRY